MKQLFPKNSIIVANKRGRNLQELLTRADPDNIKSDLLDRKVSCIISKATGRKYWIRMDSSCATINVIYLPYCTKCGEQGRGSTVSWKSRLSKL